VSAVYVARAERAALCDLFAALGPDAPTLCTGWTTRDLAAHLVIRERRPDAAVGIVVKPLSGHTERVRAAAATRPYPDLIAELRRPPIWSMAGFGPLDRATNTLEYFIHHEDVRRAQPDWAPRRLDQPTARALWHGVPGSARLALRKFRAGVEITAPGYGKARGGHGEVQVRLTGDPGELILFLTGRQRAARVEITGPEELTTKLSRARLGF
jgi:uncharacterized protein (TIGR03085 family)